MIKMIKFTFLFMALWLWPAFSKMSRSPSGLPQFHVTDNCRQKKLSNPDNGKYSKILAYLKGSKTPALRQKRLKPRGGGNQ